MWLPVLPLSGSSVSQLKRKNIVGRGIYSRPSCEFCLKPVLIYIQLLEVTSVVYGKGRLHSRFIPAVMLPSGRQDLSPHKSFLFLWVDIACGHFNKSYSAERSQRVDIYHVLIEILKKVSLEIWFLQNHIAVECSWHLLHFEESSHFPQYFW